MVRKEILGILNKIAKETFGDLSKELVKVVEKVQSAAQLNEALEQIFRKAVLEAQYAQLYAGVCVKLKNVVPHESPTVTFEQQLIKKLREELLSSQGKKNERQHYLGTLHFLAALFHPKCALQAPLRPLVLEVVSVLLHSSSQDWALEGLCKLMPAVARTTSAQSDVSLDSHLEKFSRCRSATPRVKFLLLDATEAVQKARKSSPKVAGKGRTRAPRGRAWSTEAESRKRLFFSSPRWSSGFTGNRSLARFGMPKALAS